MSSIPSVNPVEYGFYEADAIKRVSGASSLLPMNVYDDERSVNSSFQFHAGGSYRLKDVVDASVIWSISGSEIRLTQVNSSGETVNQTVCYDAGCSLFPFAGLICSGNELHVHVVTVSVHNPLVLRISFPLGDGDVCVFNSFNSVSPLTLKLPFSDANLDIVEQLRFELLSQDELLVYAVGDDKMAVFNLKYHTSETLSFATASTSFLGSFFSALVPSQKTSFRVSGAVFSEAMNSFFVMGNDGVMRMLNRRGSVVAEMVIRSDVDLSQGGVSECVLRLAAQEDGEHLLCVFTAYNSCARAQVDLISICRMPGMSIEDARQYGEYVPVKASESTGCKVLPSSPIESSDHMHLLTNMVSITDSLAGIKSAFSTPVYGNLVRCTGLQIGRGTISVQYATQGHTVSRMLVSPFSFLYNSAHWPVVLRVVDAQYKVFVCTSAAGRGAVGSTIIRNSDDSACGAAWLNVVSPSQASLALSRYELLKYTPAVLVEHYLSMQFQPARFTLNDIIACMTTFAVKYGLRAPVLVDHTDVYSVQRNLIALTDSISSQLLSQGLNQGDQSSVLVDVWEEFMLLVYACDEGRMDGILGLGLLTGIDCPVLIRARSVSLVFPLDTFSSFMCSQVWLPGSRNHATNILEDRAFSFVSLQGLGFHSSKTDLDAVKTLLFEATKLIKHLEAEHGAGAAIVSLSRHPLELSATALAEEARDYLAGLEMDGESSGAVAALLTQHARLLVNLLTSDASDEGVVATHITSGGSALHSSGSAMSAMLLGCLATGRLAVEAKLQLLHALLLLSVENHLSTPATLFADTLQKLVLCRWLLRAMPRVNDNLLSEPITALDASPLLLTCPVYLEALRVGTDLDTKLLVQVCGDTTLNYPQMFFMHLLRQNGHLQPYQAIHRSLALLCIDKSTPTRFNSDALACQARISTARLYSLVLPFLSLLELYFNNNNQTRHSEEYLACDELLKEYMSRISFTVNLAGLSAVSHIHDFQALACSSNDDEGAAEYLENTWTTALSETLYDPFSAEVFISLLLRAPQSSSVYCTIADIACVVFERYLKSLVLAAKQGALAHVLQQVSSLVYRSSAISRVCNAQIARLQSATERKVLAAKITSLQRLSNEMYSIEVGGKPLFDREQSAVVATALFEAALSSKNYGDAQVAVLRLPEHTQGEALHRLLQVLLNSHQGTTALLAMSWPDPSVVVAELTKLGSTASLNACLPCYVSVSHNQLVVGPAVCLSPWEVLYLLHLQNNNHIEAGVQQHTLYKNLETTVYAHCFQQNSQVDADTALCALGSMYRVLSQIGSLQSISSQGLHLTSSSSQSILVQSIEDVRFLNAVCKARAKLLFSLLKGSSDLSLDDYVDVLYPQNKPADLLNLAQALVDCPTPFFEDAAYILLQACRLPSSASRVASTTQSVSGWCGTLQCSDKVSFRSYCEVFVSAIMRDAYDSVPYTNTSSHDSLSLYHLQSQGHQQVNISRFDQSNRFSVQYNADRMPIGLSMQAPSSIDVKLNHMLLLLQNSVPFDLGYSLAAVQEAVERRCMIAKTMVSNTVTEHGALLLPNWFADFTVASDPVYAHLQAVLDAAVVQQEQWKEQVEHVSSVFDCMVTHVSMVLMALLQHDSHNEVCALLAHLLRFHHVLAALRQCTGLSRVPIGKLGVITEQVVRMVKTHLHATAEIQELLSVISLVGISGCDVTGVHPYDLSLKGISTQLLFLAGSNSVSTMSDNISTAYGDLSTSELISSVFKGKSVVDDNNGLVMTDDKPADKPSFSFVQHEKLADKPSFSFETPADKPSFSFGQNEKPADKPSFSFGQNEKPADKPSFSFGQNEKPADKPSFSFGQNEKPTDKPSFSFGQNEKPTDKPSFSFGQNEKPADKATTTTATTPATSGFTFGSSVSDKPTFSFSTNTTSNLPIENFAPPPVSSFNFGNDANGTKTTTTDDIMEYEEEHMDEAEGDDQIYGDMYEGEAHGYEGENFYNQALNDGEEMEFQEGDEVQQYEEDHEQFADEDEVIELD